MRPQAHIQAQAKDRVLQRRTTLRDEEPDNRQVLVDELLESQRSELCVECGADTK
jgi:hypothetical protein